MNAIEKNADVPRIPIRPPVVLYWGLALGGLFEFALGKSVPWSSPTLSSAVGALLVALGAVVMALAVRAFKKAETNIRTTLPARRLVTKSIYRITRNPMYLGFLLMGLGIACCFRSFFLLAGLLPFFLYIRFFVIPSEERSMQEQFQEAYTIYCHRTGRWFGMP